MLRLRTLSVAGRDVRLATTCGGRMGSCRPSRFAPDGAPSLMCKEERSSQGAGVRTYVKGASCDAADWVQATEQGGAGQKEETTPPGAEISRYLASATGTPGLGVSRWAGRGRRSTVPNPASS